MSNIGKSERREIEDRSLWVKKYEIRKGQIRSEGVKYLRYFFEIGAARYYYTRF
jgi:hypothetical protein